MNNETPGNVEPAQATADVQVQILADSTVSYASYQNNVPLLRDLSITNATDQPLHDVEVAIRCEPEVGEVSGEVREHTEQRAGPDSAISDCGFVQFGLKVRTYGRFGIRNCWRSAALQSRCKMAASTKGKTVAVVAARSATLIRVLVLC